MTRLGDSSALWNKDTSLLDALGAAVIATDLEGWIRYWNPAAEQLYGYSRDQMIGANVIDLLVAEPDAEPASQIMAQVLAGGSWTGQFRVRRSDGGSVAVRITDSPLWSEGTVVGVLGVAEDLSTVQAAEAVAERVAATLTRLARVIADLGTARDAADVIRVVVSQAADALDASTASVCLPVDPDTLELVGVRGASPGVVSRWARFPVTAQVPLAEAFRTRRRILLSGRQAVLSHYPDMAVDLEGERTLAALPLTVADRAIGTIGLSFAGLRTFDAQELEFLATLADAVAQALERVRAVEAVARRSAQQAFLADASVQLSRSLDYRATLAKVARLAVPVVADWCTVDMAEDGHLRTLAVAHADPGRQALAEELQRRYPPDPAATAGAANVARTGVSELRPVIGDDVLASGARDAEHLRLMRAVGICSEVTVPLTVRGQVLGVITAIRSVPKQPYDGADLALLEDLARRAAVAIDNAQLHSQTREAAIRLQRAVLPDRLPVLPEWELASSYRAAGRTEVGGDFYDAISFPGDRLAVFVGDVMGRGVKAAAAMAHMRAAIRAYLAVDPDPGTLLRRLDQMFTTLDLNQLVTVVYLIADASSDTAHLVNAGHPPPLIVRYDGSVELLPLADGAPLGAGTAQDRTVIGVPFGAGDTLLAYTDGLVERRGEDIDVGLRRLAEHAASLSRQPLQVGLDRLCDELHDETRDDDVTALAVRRVG